jgi:hypothetical protein
MKLCYKVNLAIIISELHQKPYFRLLHENLILVMPSASSFLPKNTCLQIPSDCFNLKVVTYNALTDVTFDQFAGIYWCVQAEESTGQDFGNIIHKCIKIFTQVLNIQFRYIYTSLKTVGYNYINK